MDASVWTSETSGADGTSGTTGTDGTRSPTGGWRMVCANRLLDDKRELASNAAKMSVCERFAEANQLQRRVLLRLGRQRGC